MAMDIFIPVYVCVMCTIVYVHGLRMFVSAKKSTLGKIFYLWTNKFVWFFFPCIENSQMHDLFLY